MKTKLQKTLFFSALALLGMQAVSAQYVGVPFPDKTTPLAIGETTNVETRIELENFDSVEDGTGFYIDGLNTGNTTTSPPVTGTYNDKSAGSGGDNTTYRPGADVDLMNDATGIVVTGIQGQEYALYTIEIKEDGDYDFTVNYRINAGIGSKNLQVWLRDANDLSSEGILFNGTLNVGTGAYEDMKIVDTEALTAGIYVLLVRYVSAGPRFDYIAVTRTSTLSVEENKLKASKFKAFPNPANDGIFNLNIEAKWDVYSLIGTKVLEGEGKQVDLSTFAKGAYILRTPFTSKMLISK
ncbi:hypothetical protein DIS18_07870 [Algibacter marinivivus]|uniref:Por secretion system C-terminal sorting domain-containing protein n=1 Tax=Algibacter marinivivus TaxID=2100723 RepID=A0A2U2X9F0_9FLAO|nr:hypothetical protein [Algibacter marinivivus]PWH84437.1 hypothetical protein DIS18_07870 [Algibacter marinivivus]